MRDLTQDTNTVYTHPATKQCNYSVSVINNLTSSSTTAALSANQGRLLNQSVSNGKNQVANAITGKGVAASGSDSFATLANKIRQIRAVPESSYGILQQAKATITTHGRVGGTLTIISGPKMVYANGTPYRIYTSSEWNSPFEVGTLGIFFYGPGYYYRIGATAFTLNLNTGAVTPTGYEGGASINSYSMHGNTISLTMSLVKDLSLFCWDAGMTDKSAKTIIMRWDNIFMNFSLYFNPTTYIVSKIP